MSKETQEALEAAEQALTAAVAIVDKRAPAWASINRALGLVRGQLGIKAQWL